HRQGRRARAVVAAGSRGVPELCRLRAEDHAPDPGVRRIAMVTRPGIVLSRRTDRGLEVLLGHMGGPYWAKKDDGAWSIPKGEYDDTEDAYAAARREVAAESGPDAPGT